MQIEDLNDDGAALWLAGLDDLWLYWSSAPVGLVGREHRRAVFGSFASGLQGRWAHGGYNFRFVEQTRAPDAAIADDSARAEATLQATFSRLREDALEWTWGGAVAALDDFLDRWLLFRRRRPYVRYDDVPDWMIPALREPWAACVRELGGDTIEARAAVLEGECLADDWGDHGVALVLASGSRLCVLHVGLWTD
ncbi:hypothetical protein [Nannocystis punicea]|uniref:Uncharacterized protein n=1 Tax=Nannocystis punicea TaxID=2995304 RepID=A0ABY7HDZ1_9BACT|nr:hypothetical protein [Nannocystis poenicansa]WAS97300.1 hypothetical protein O0S08_14225 [Nannocystis poenicansa]